MALVCTAHSVTTGYGIGLPEGISLYSLVSYRRVTNMNVYLFVAIFYSIINISLSPAEHSGQLSWGKAQHPQEQRYP